MKYNTLVNWIKRNKTMRSSVECKKKPTFHPIGSSPENKRENSSTSSTMNSRAI